MCNKSTTAKKTDQNKKPEAIAVRRLNNPNQVACGINDDSYVKKLGNLADQLKENVTAINRLGTHHTQAMTNLGTRMKLHDAANEANRLVIMAAIDQLTNLVMEVATNTKELAKDRQKPRTPAVKKGPSRKPRTPAECKNPKLTLRTPSVKCRTSTPLTPPSRMRLAVDAPIPRTPRIPKTPNSPRTGEVMRVLQSPRVLKLAGESLINQTRISAKPKKFVVEEIDLVKPRHVLGQSYDPTVIVDITASPDHRNKVFHDRSPAPPGHNTASPGQSSTGWCSTDVSTLFPCSDEGSMNSGLLDESSLRRFVESSFEDSFDDPSAWMKDVHLDTRRVQLSPAKVFPEPYIPSGKLIPKSDMNREDTTKYHTKLVKGNIRTKRTRTPGIPCAGLWKNGWMSYNPQVLDRSLIGPAAPHSRFTKGVLQSQLTDSSTLVYPFHESHRLITCIREDTDCPIVGTNTMNECPVLFPSATMLDMAVRHVDLRYSKRDPADNYLLWDKMSSLVYQLMKAVYGPMMRYLKISSGPTVEEDPYMVMSYNCRQVRLLICTVFARAGVSPLKKMALKYVIRSVQHTRTTYVSTLNRHRRNAALAGPHKCHASPLKSEVTGTDDDGRMGDVE